MSFFKNFDWDFFGIKKLGRKVTELQEEVKQLKEEPPVRPFRIARYLNGNLIVTLHDGRVLQATRTNTQFESLKTMTTQQEVEELMSDIVLPVVEASTVKEDVQNAERLAEREETVLEILGEDFSLQGSNYLYKNISLPVHPLVLNSLIEHKKARNEEGFDSVKNFFLKLASAFKNENRDNIMDFIRHNDVRLTRTGNIIGYRRIVTIPIEKKEAHNESLVGFVIKEYLKFKKNKKSPANYDVYRNVGTNDTYYSLLKWRKTPLEGTWEYLDNLAVLYKNATIVFEQPKQLYTSWHNSGKHKFGIGDIYRLEDENQIDTNRLCSGSAGTHFASVSYNYEGFGDTPVVVLINPAMTTVVPSYDRGKARTIEMKIAMVNPNDHGVHIDPALLEEADKEYNTYTIEQMEQALVAKDFGPLDIQGKQPEVTKEDLQVIKVNLEEVRNSLKEKVVMI